jgi:hypothetical protein
MYLFTAHDPRGTAAGDDDAKRRVAASFLQPPGDLEGESGAHAVPEEQRRLVAKLQELLCDLVGQDLDVPDAGLLPAVLPAGILQRDHVDGGREPL